MAFFSPLPSTQSDPGRSVVPPTAQPDQRSEVVHEGLPPPPKVVQQRWDKDSSLLQRVIVPI